MFVLEYIDSGNVRLVFTENYMYLNGKYCFQISIVRRLQSHNVYRIDKARNVSYFCCLKVYEVVCKLLFSGIFEYTKSHKNTNVLNIKTKICFYILDFWRYFFYNNTIFTIQYFFTPIISVLYLEEKQLLFCLMFVLSIQCIKILIYLWEYNTSQKQCGQGKYNIYLQIIRYKLS